MRRRTWSTAAVVAGAAAALVVAMTVRRSAADDDAPAGGPTATLERVMGAIGDGKIDDAVGLMDGLRARADQKDAARVALLAVRDGQLGAWHGSDVAEVVRFTARLQTVDEVGYFDQQPVLYRFECFEPVAGGPWQVLNLKVEPDLNNQVETLREDAGGVSLGRGGRAAR